MAAEDSSDLEVEDRFAIVPEWLLDADISDCSVRLYAVLLRYGATSGARMPSRKTLATRLHKKSVDSVDRALRELSTIGAVVVQPRFVGNVRLTNLYRVRTSRPSSLPAAPLRPTLPAEAGSTDGRRNTATTTGAATSGRKFVATRGRMGAANPAAGIGHDRQSFTENNNHHPTIASQCGITDWLGYVDQVRQARDAVRAPVGRWNAHCLDAALQLAVLGRGWPALDAPAALLEIAVDSITRSPMRLAEAGPWWDRRSPGLVAPAATWSPEEVVAAEAELADLGGLRVILQRDARAALTAAHEPVTRSTVAMKAVELHRARTEAAAPAIHKVSA